MSDVEKTFEEQVSDFLENQINPLLASHGGFVRLSKVEGQDVHLELGGGCQGCPGARATMRNGIEAALRENIQGVGEVLDVTDHGAGMAPFQG